jgi:hypothetical protein
MEGSCLKYFPLALGHTCLLHGLRRALDERILELATFLVHFSGRKITTYTCFLVE